MNTLKIKINYLTYLVIVLFLFSGFKNNLKYILLVFTVHELGHIFFCKLFKVEIISVEVYPFGGVIKLNNFINSSLIMQFLISSGGLIFQLFLFFIKNPFINSYNMYFLLINIIPVIPLDGSKILLNTLCCFFSYYKSLIITNFISIFSLIIVIFFTRNITFFIFSLVFIIRDLRNFLYYFNKFLLERYLYDFNYKKSKNYKKLDLKKLKIGKLGYFYENKWKSEKYFLAKKFDKNL